MFSVARLELKHPKKDLGKWDFVELPREGDYLAIRINDQPTVLRVENKIHSPVMWPAISETKQEVPSVLILVSIAGSNEASNFDV